MVCHWILPRGKFAPSNLHQDLLNVYRVWPCRTFISSGRWTMDNKEKYSFDIDAVIADIQDFIDRWRQRIACSGQYGVRAAICSWKLALYNGLIIVLVVPVVETASITFGVSLIYVKLIFLFFKKRRKQTNRIWKQDRSCDLARGLVATNLVSEGSRFLVCFSYINIQ